ncbi:MAG: hypothetical protein WBV23_00160 [Desulfobaccales bacterium]
MNLPTNQPDMVIFAENWHTCPTELGYLNAVDLKNSRKAPPDNGVIEEKPKLHAHTTAGNGNGPAGNKIWMERAMHG